MKARKNRSVAVCVLAAAIPFSAQAQTATAALDLTAANTSYGSSFSGTSFGANPWVHVDAPLSVLDAGFTYSTLAGSWTAQGNASGSLFTPRFSSLMGEIAASGGGSAHEDGTRSGSFSGMGRLHLLNDLRGAWIGGDGGKTWDGTTWRNLVQGEIGAWTTIPAGTVSAVVTPSQLADTIRYTDAEGSLSIFQGRTGLDLSVGFRTGSSLPVAGGDAKSWGSATGTFWVTKSIAILASAGTYPVDFGQGFPGGHFVSAGIRIGAMPRSVRNRGNSRDAITDLAVRVDPPPPPPPYPGFDATPVAGGLTRIAIYAPGVSKVEIAGDFSNWDPVALTRDSREVWSTTLRISRGVHEINVRRNSGAWEVPEGLERKNDEFGGSVGLLVVGM
jgi:hypothetical protein